jgi:UDP-N-acetylglucosamine:LPS N-acetylglucosamine transferase
MRRTMAPLTRPPRQGDEAIRDASHSLMGVAGPTVLILSAPTGAGHDCVARAVADALYMAIPRARVLVQDPLRRTATDPLEVGRVYDLVAGRAPHLWGWCYRLSNNRWGVWLGATLMAALWGRRLRAAIHVARPDLIVSVHPLCARLAADTLRREGHPTPHHCVVTDLASIHRCWASPGVDVFYAATPQAAAALKLHGIPAGRIRVTGLPLRRAFAASPPIPDIRDDGPAPRVAVLDGGRATRALERAAHVLLAADPPLRVTIVCGGNARLGRRLTRITAGRATVLGWCDDMAGLMRASDVVVTKAGSVTLAEAWSQGRPALVYHVFPGQEEGNVALLERDGGNEYVPAVGALPAAVQRAHGRAPSEKHTAWWGQAADRVAACVADALSAQRTIPSADAPPRPVAPHDTLRHE